MLQAYVERKLTLAFRHPANKAQKHSDNGFAFRGLSPKFAK